ncbi:hypothetical protein BLA55_02755 [Mycoplasmopsis pullorum]|uniref:Endonuclease I n=1 Tax=Mycoplasmopsis pullorum TaxID=48003 RepID=A0A1L4FSH2_9BACT|nr:hypothetical protein BLA55_02755 [Mycoplasmopsis pullorum]
MTNLSVLPFIATAAACDYKSEAIKPTEPVNGQGDNNKETPEQPKDNQTPPTTDNPKNDGSKEQPKENSGDKEKTPEGPKEETPKEDNTPSNPTDEKPTTPVDNASDKSEEPKTTIQKDKNNVFELVDEDKVIKFINDELGNSNISLERTLFLGSNKSLSFDNFSNVFKIRDEWTSEEIKFKKGFNRVRLNVIIERKKITIVYSFTDDSKEYSQVFEIKNPWVESTIESSNNNSNTPTPIENSNKPVEEPNNTSNENSDADEINGEEILIEDGSTLEVLKAEVDFAKSKNWDTIRLYIDEEETYFINGNSKSPKRIGLIKPGIQLEKLTVKSAGSKKYITATYTDNSVTLNYTYNNVEYSQGFGWGKIDQPSEEPVVVDENSSDSNTNGTDPSEAFDATNLFIVANEDNLKETIAKAKKYPNIRAFLQPQTEKFLYSKKEIFTLKPGADSSKLELESSGSSQYIQFNFKNGNKYDLEGAYNYDGKRYIQRIYLGEGPRVNTNNENQPSDVSGTSNTTGGTSTSNNPNNSGTTSDNSGTPVDLSISNSTHYEANSYYSSLQGKRGKELLESLYALQKSKTSRIGSYASLYDIYTRSFIDKYSENDGTIWDIYSENPSGPDPYYYTFEKRVGGGGSGKSGKNEGTGFNREHVIPQSWFGKVSPTVSDAHFIWPTDAKVNERRGNLPHFNVSNPSWTSQNGTKVGGGYSEPIDFFKGDVARAYFYFQATHRNGMATDNGRKVFTGVFPYFTDQFLNEYLSWSNNDPVDLSEVDRNNAIDNYYGGLRNPFIDYPNLPNLIWGDGSETFNDQGILVRN